MKKTRIEKTVRNPKAAAICSLFLLLPMAGFTLCALVPFHNPSHFRDLWPVVLLVALGCVWIFFIILSGCFFSAHGKYIIEYDNQILSISAHSTLRKSHSAFPWSEVLKVGFLDDPRGVSRGSLFVEMPRRFFRFGDELKYEEQIELAQELYETHQRIKNQQPPA
jgi:hypothetical protein